jgi:glucose/arabinose dehydrogenase
MRFLLAGYVVWLSVGVARVEASDLNTLSDAEKRAGWKLLFDGSTTQGWRNYGKPSISDGWKVSDGSLTRSADGAGDIVTVDQYDRFELSLEFLISKGGNSGVMYHVVERASERAPQSGPEIQIQDNVQGRDRQKCGWLYQLYSTEKDAAKPAGEWNQLRIRITPELCGTYVNGVNYAQYVKGSDDWNQRVAASKFARFPNFGKATKGHICLQDHGALVAYRNVKIRELTGDTDDIDPVDGTLAYQPAVAFPELKWSGWSPITDEGKLVPLRPIVLTHAGDGSNRVFVATQQGVIHVFDNDQSAPQTTVFLDMSKRVTYSDHENEEGFLGLAFHPQYARNGEFFVYYTTRQAPHTSVVSRFRVSPDDPDKADSQFEEELMRIEQPYWNHNGGTLAFGPDGYLYIGLGDGGSANDPHGYGQDRRELLGSILRIDVDRESAGKNYAIPSTNPFVDDPHGARGEIWAYGLRNVWRLAFDRQTGDLWAADVGQDLWEEINIIQRGGNYGWNLREGAHPFGPHGRGSAKELCDPIWEYDHEVGKSITGGYVYRGNRLPELQGAYLYADYVTGRLWALRYDPETKRVVSNHALHSDRQPVISFGEDEAGEVYFMVVTHDGRGIYRFDPKR